MIICIYFLFFSYSDDGVAKFSTLYNLKNNHAEFYIDRTILTSLPIGNDQSYP